MVPEMIAYVCLGVLAVFICILFRNAFIPCNSRSDIEEIYHEFGNS
jgi:hypothetical protein